MHLLKAFSAIKPALVSWETPPRGEPGEPRPTVGLRTLGSQQRGATNVENYPRLRNRNRGIRSPEKVLHRKSRAKQNKRLSISQTRKNRTSTPLEARHRLARCVSNYLVEEGNRAFKDSYNTRHRNDRHYTGHKIHFLSICCGQDIEDKTR